MNQLILKSASPRRKEILNNLGLTFTVSPTNSNESEISGEKPLDYLNRVTLHKLESKLSIPDNTYISSDTIVVIEDQILQKPKDFEDGIQMISKLSRRKHFVYSGLGIFKNGNIHFDYDSTEIEFYPLSLEQIKSYLELFKPYDKA